MYNTDLPTRAELPSAIKLMQSTILAAIVALTLLITVVMPSEYGIDPTGVGRLLGLKQMGEIKTQLAEEADADNQATLEPHRQHQDKHDDDDGFDQVDDKRSQRIPHTLGLIEYFMAIYSGRQTVIFQLLQLIYIILIRDKIIIIVYTIII